MNRNRYSGKVRIRSCGILIEEKKILLIKLHSPVTNEMVWMPPGGEVEFGESLAEAAQREFFEETGLKVSVEDLLHVNELIENNIHAIELYYSVKRKGGDLKIGSDPEISSEDQIIKEIGFFSKNELTKINVVPAYILESLWETLELS